jgi:hypothetical protein
MISTTNRLARGAPNFQVEPCGPSMRTQCRHGHFLPHAALNELFLQIVARKIQHAPGHLSNLLSLPIYHHLKHLLELGVCFVPSPYSSHLSWFRWTSAQEVTNLIELLQDIAKCLDLLPSILVLVVLVVVIFSILLGFSGPSKA